MRYFLQTTPDANGATPPPPSPELFAEMGKFIELGFSNGTLIATGSLDPHKTHISSTNGKITVTDGPFAEAKEAVVGWALVEVGSKEEAIELSKRFWKLVGDGSGVIQRVYGPEDLARVHPG
jgi:hypothetical protein